MRFVSAQPHRSVRPQGAVDICVARRHSPVRKVRHKIERTSLGLRPPRPRQCADLGGWPAAGDVQRGPCTSQRQPQNDSCDRRLSLRSVRLSHTLTLTKALAYSKKCAAVSNSRLAEHQQWRSRLVAQKVQQAMLGTTAENKDGTEPGGSRKLQRRRRRTGSTTRSSPR